MPLPSSQTVVRTVLGAVVVVTALPAGPAGWTVFYSIHAPQGLAPELTQPIALCFDGIEDAVHWAFGDAARQLNAAAARTAA